MRTLGVSSSQGLVRAVQAVRSIPADPHPPGLNAVSGTACYAGTMREQPAEDDETEAVARAALRSWLQRQTNRPWPELVALVNDLNRDA